jgi:hypothetical protein
MNPYLILIKNKTSKMCVGGGYIYIYICVTMDLHNVTWRNFAVNRPCIISILGWVVLRDRAHCDSHGVSCLVTSETGRIGFSLTGQGCVVRKQRGYKGSKCRYSRHFSVIGILSSAKSGIAFFCVRCLWKNNYTRVYYSYICIYESY